MNILPKKSWHVRTNKNIERVKRDEAKAEEDDKKRLERAALADQEARTALLQRRARQLTAASQDNSQPCRTIVKSPDQDVQPAHLDLFNQANPDKSIVKTNPEREREEKEEKESYEKKIGLLTYLGQSSAEAQTTKPWYLKPDRGNDKEESSIIPDAKRKATLDPLVEMEKYLGSNRGKIDKTKLAPKSVPKPSTETRPTMVNPVSMSHAITKHEGRSDGKKHKSHVKHKHRLKEKPRKHKKHKRSESLRDINTGGPSIQQLREARLQREAAERIRTNRLLSGKPQESENLSREITDQPGRYNSQYHPELMRKRNKTASS